MILYVDSKPIMLMLNAQVWLPEDAAPRVVGEVGIADGESRYYERSPIIMAWSGTTVAALRAFVRAASPAGDTPCAI